MHCVDKPGRSAADTRELLDKAAVWVAAPGLLSLVDGARRNLENLHTGIKYAVTTLFLSIENYVVSVDNREYWRYALPVPGYPAQLKRGHWPQGVRRCKQQSPTCSPSRHSVRRWRPRASR